MLLRNFCINSKEQLHVYDKLNERSFTTKIDNIAAERNFNVATLDEELINAEPYFTRLESDTKPIINKILASLNLTEITEEEKNTLSYFIVSQYFRTRHFRDHLKHFKKSMANQIKKMGFENEEINQLGAENENESKIYSLSFLENSPEMANYILQKDWHLMKTSNKQSILLSDNPVTLHNDNDYGPYGNLGFAVPGIQIYFPLSPNVSLALLCPSIFKTANEKYLELQKNIRQLEAQKTLGANNAIRDNASLQLNQIKKILESEEYKQTTKK
jgi:hypothetical protein